MMWLEVGLLTVAWVGVKLEEFFDRKGLCLQSVPQIAIVFENQDYTEETSSNTGM